MLPLKKTVCLLAFPFALFSSCKKNENRPVNMYPEIYPSKYVSTEWHVSTPYVRMFTRNGEVSNQNSITEYLQRKWIADKFWSQQVVPEHPFYTTEFHLFSTDNIVFRIMNDQIPNMITIYGVSEIENNGLYFKSSVSKKEDMGSGLMAILKLKNALSLYKWEYEVFPDLSDTVFFGDYKYKPEFYAHKIDTNLLAMPNVRFHNTGFSMTAYNCANKFNISVCDSLSPTDTLVIQESELIYKRVW